MRRQDDYRGSTPVFWRWSDLILVFVVGFGLLTFGLTIAASSLIAVVSHTNAVTQGLTIISLLIEGVAVTGCVYLFGVRRKHLTWTAFGLRGVSRGWVWTAVGLGLAVRLLAIVFGFVAQVILHLPTNTLQAETFLPQGLTWLGILGILMLGGLVVPFAEELAFRGVLFPFMRERWPYWVALVGSSLVFALVHFEPLVMAPVFVLGLVCAELYERGHSLWLPIVVHAVYNTTGFLLAYVVVAGMTHIPLA